MYKRLPLQPFIDAVYISKKAIEFITKLGLLEEFREIIAKHPEDLVALESLEKTIKEFKEAKQ